MLKSFLTFDNLITPKIINIIYWLSIVGYMIFGLFAISAGTLIGIIMGIVTIVGGILFSRITCEMILIAFRIYEQLKSINENTKK